MENRRLLKILSIVCVVVIMATTLVACSENNDNYDLYMPGNIRPSLFKKPKEIIFK